MFSVANPDVVARRLSDGDIHLWWFPLCSAVGDFSSYLTPAEVARQSRIESPPVRNGLGLARGGLRHILAAYVSRPHACAAWIRGRHGKPSLCPQFNPHGIQFNLAHSRNHAAVVVARNAAVGVDVEQVRAPGRLGAVADKYFSEVERDWLRLGPADAWAHRFIRLWTMKEAAIKAAGEPVATGLREFRFAPLECRLIAVPAGVVPPGEWRIETLMVDAQVHLAVAGIRTKGELRTYRLERSTGGS